MRIVFDAYWWVEGPISNRMVQRRIIREWIRARPDDEAILLVPARHRTEAARDLPPGARLVTTRLRPHGLAVAVDAPRAVREQGADVVVAHNFTPLRGPAVTFVHDVLFRSDPEWFTRAERLYLGAIPRLARRAGGPVAVATSSRTEAERISGLEPALPAVTAVGLAPDPDLLAADPRRPVGAPDGPFLLTVARLNLRKNLARTIGAALDSGVVSPKRPLVVVGEADGRAAALGPEVAAASDGGAVRFLGHVEVDELAWLFAHTDLFCYLSLGEGFGLPPVEAAAFGAPLLVSDLPVFRETVGDRAVLADPTDPAALASAFRAAIDDRAAKRTVPIESYDWGTVVGKLRELAVGVTARGGVVR